jgi:hypothetical protein
MKLSDRVSVPSQVMDRSVGNETVILDLAAGSYFKLDPIGARMWQLMGERKTLGEISKVLLEEYDVSCEQLEQDLLKLAEELVEKGLLVRE